MITVLEIKLLQAVGLEGATYHMHEMYPTKELVAIINRASEVTGIPINDLMEQFGEFLVPDLLLIYSKYMNPNWCTYEMLLHTESSMHCAVKSLDGRTNPPKLLVTKKGSNQLIVDYHSRRRMSGVAVGIIKGIAKYFNESETISVTCLTAANEERVQIQVKFLN